MNEVSGQAWTFFERVAPRHGLPLETLVAGLPMSVADLRRAWRIDWELFVELLERLLRHTGAEALERAAAESTLGSPITVPLRRTAGWLLSPRRFYEFALRLLPRFVFGPALTMSATRLDRDRLAVDVKIDPERRESSAIMHVVRGALGAMPGLVGLPPAEVAGQIDPRASRFVLTLPRPSLGARLRQLAVSMNPFEELARQRAALGDAEIAEARATQSAERLLRTLVDAVAEAIFVVDAGCRLRFASRALERALGWREGSAAGVPLLDHVHPDDVARMRALCAGQLGDAAHHVRIRAQDGGWRELELNARDLRDDPVVGGILVHGRDVTERRQAESEERAYGLLLRNLAGMAYRARRADGKLELVSEGCQPLLGYRVAELLETPMRDLIHPEEVEALRARRVPQLDAHLPSTEEYRVRTQAGEWRWVLDNARGVYDERGALVAVEGFLSDITARKRLEEQLAHAQRLEGLGRLAGGVAHDFNNLLGAMLGYTALVKRALPPGSNAGEDLAALEDTVRRAATLTGKMLAVARRQVIRPRVLDANELVLGMDKLLRRTLGEDIELSTVTAREVWPTEADPGQLEQVLLNLAVNARDAMPEGGSLTIETANVVVDEPDGDLQPGEYVLIAVTDTGAGMTEEIRRHAFEPFFTTKPHGIGLGLATSFGAVTQARGRLTLESEPGRGTTFRIYLPRSSKPAPRVVQVAPPPVTGGGESVLLVEDHALLRNVAARALDDAGYKVVAAANGDEALLAAARMLTIDIVVTDMVMPGMPGVVLAERLHAERPGLPVLFMSGYSDTPAAADTHFLAKPFTPAMLAAKVREVLDRRPGER